MQPQDSTQDPRIRRAVRIVAALQQLDECSAHEELRARANRAGVAESEIARLVLLFHGDD